MAGFDLSGKAAIVTGGNGGIGRGIAIGLAEAGADVCIAARNQEKSEEVRAEIEGLGRRCICQPCDVDDAADIDATIAATRDAFGGLQILVNNAGIAAINAPEQMTDDEWSGVLETNLTSVFRFCRAAYPSLAEKGGKIINLGSMYSLFGSSLVPSYAASKGGVIQLTKSLAVAWAPQNIQVNAILPGWITTDMTAPVMNDLPDMYRQIVARTPAGRFGEPEECAGAVVFLAAAASDFVTGQSLAVCGGYSIR
ncbi:MAG: glucose 1-dehydrogenase [Thermoanaerobaculia bacterium]|nr:glucose 1-dehydrogenase [Thermoanaerobaculia bacterium]